LSWKRRQDSRSGRCSPDIRIVVIGKSAGWTRGRAESERMLVKRLIPLIELPGQVLVIATQGRFRKLAATVATLPGSQIFRWDQPEASSWLSRSGAG
jgi:hypothetical protein